MRFQYSTPDGGVAIVHAAPMADLEKVLGPLSEENYMAHVIGKSLPPGVKKVLVLADDWTPPESREFRNAWRLTEDGQIEIDMPKARDIHRDKLRLHRAREFLRLDTDALIALSQGDHGAAATIDEEKQRLRDAPAHPAIEAAATADELSAITLSKLLAS
jgi:hypothetical protein